MFMCFFVSLRVRFLMDSFEEWRDCLLGSLMVEELSVLNYKDILKLNKC